MKENIHRIVTRRRSLTQTKRNSVWTREKINQLIELYKKHDCLWNHWNDSYKNKEKRKYAIEQICSILSISKFDFGKKIHNLRNQFNSEMKKLEQRLEAGGGISCIRNSNSHNHYENVDASGDDNKPIPRCKWSHFESLMFLKDVIEPRPGGYQSSFQTSKKIQIKLDYNNEFEESEAYTNISQQNSGITNENRIINNSLATSSNTIGENSRLVVVNGNSTSLLDINDHNSNQNQIQTISFVDDQERLQGKEPRISLATVNNPENPNQMAIECYQSHSNEELTTVATNISSLNDPLGNDQILDMYDSKINSGSPSTSTTISLGASSLSSVTNGNVAVKKNNRLRDCRSTNLLNSNSIPLQAPSITNLRDQWDIFGDLIATEFRHLSSDISRKKLKRKILQAMLEIGEEDDKIVN